MSWTCLTSPQSPAGGTVSHLLGQCVNCLDIALERPQNVIRNRTLHIHIFQISTKLALSIKLNYNVFIALTIKLSAKYVYEVIRISSKLIGCAALSLHSAMCSPWSEPTYTAATYETTAVRYRHADHATWSPHRNCCGQRSLHSGSNPCARIRRRSTLHSSLLRAGRCRGQMWWTSYRSDGSVRRRRCPSTQPPAAWSCLPRSVLWTYCTRRSTSRFSYVTATHISAYSGRSLSADWAVRCRASSCRLRCGNRL